MKIPYIGSEELQPTYGSSSSAGADLRANIQEPEILSPGEYKMIPTGIILEIPHGYEGQVRPRSGLAAKFGVTVLNSPGTIDADYRGEIRIILINHGKNPFTINPMERIAQLIIAPVIQVDFIQTNNLKETERGEGGFGSTGVH